jgi:hypothetical protein
LAFTRGRGGDGIVTDVGTDWAETLSDGSKASTVQTYVAPLTRPLSAQDVVPASTVATSRPLRRTR